MGARLEDRPLLVPEDPHLGMDDSTATGHNRHDCPLQKSEHPARLWQGDLADLAEHGQLAGVGPQRMDQLDGLESVAVGAVGAAVPCEGQSRRCGQESPQVEGVGHRHGRLEDEAGRWPHRIDERGSVCRLQHQAQAPAAARSCR